MVDGVDVAHAIFYDTSKFFEAFVVAHTGYCAAVDKDVTLREEFEGFQGGAVWSEEALATFLEAFLVSHKAADLDNVADNVVFEDFDGLLLCCSWASRETVIVPAGRARFEREV